MQVDTERLTRFEEGLDPDNIEASAVPAKLLGYGEISAIFQIDGDSTIAYKRLPLFSDRPAAERYEAQYHEYCGFLSEAGLNLPESTTQIVEVPGHPVVLYITQKRFQADSVAHRFMHTLTPEAFERLIERIVLEMRKVWDFNASRHPSLEMAVDGQLSNWVLTDDHGEGPIYYIDTSTPLYRKTGVEQLDPGLFLQAVPGILRRPFEWLFVDDVMTRYYDTRQVCIDLAANLHKEQRPDLIPTTLKTINRNLPQGVTSLTEKEVEKYYRTDRIIWSSFLTLRRFDRWVKKRLLRKRYEFILPGKIKR